MTLAGMLFRVKVKAACVVGVREEPHWVIR